MKKKYIIIIIAIILIISSSYSVYKILTDEKEVEEKEDSHLYISQLVEDECTEEYEQAQNTTTVSSSEEKVAANAILILKKYYIKCEHTINEYVELPQELVNMTEEQVQAQYPDWEVIGFEPGKVIIYKEFDNECGEHFKLKVEDGKVVVYIVDKNGTQNLYEKTNISSEYLTETDLINMQDGLEIYGKEELNKIIEDFE